MASQVNFMCIIYVCHRRSLSSTALAFAFCNLNTILGVSFHETILHSLLLTYFLIHIQLASKRKIVNKKFIASREHMVYSG